MVLTNLPLTIAALATTALAWSGWRLYQHRSWINQLRNEGMPMPAWSWLSGHILFLMRITRRLPLDANVNLAFLQIAKQFSHDEMFLLDMWPVSEPMLIIFNPEAAVHVCQKVNLPKSAKNESMIRPITGGPALLSMNGDEWKKWRSLFSPGFSPAVMTEQLPRVIDAVDRFCDTLRERADKGIFCLDDLTVRLTFEVIMKVALGTDIDREYDKHIFVRAMSNIIQWHSFWDPLILMNPLRPLVQRYYGYMIDSWVHGTLQTRFKTLKQELATQSFVEKKTTRSIMDLVIETYVAEKADAMPDRLDDDFLKVAAHQMRLFLFAGNDTTSSTIVFTYHLLAQHHAILSRLRAEHDAVFGPDPCSAARQLKHDPSLLNKCRYTQAVIKETLRLYAPAATMRLGTPGSFLNTNAGTMLPLDGVSVIVSHHAMHANDRVWPRAEEFLPERWVVGPEHELYPQAGAWRPFELGPRNCIGQTLSMNEIKVVLIMTVRTFDIAAAYDEFDQLQGRDRVTVSLRSWKGDRAYQTEKAGAHPSDGYPCRISLRS